MYFIFKREACLPDYPYFNRTRDFLILTKFYDFAFFVVNNNNAYVFILFLIYPWDINIWLHIICSAIFQTDGFFDKKECCHKLNVELKVMYALATFSGA